MVGETIGNYRIVRQIGVGGMATVYAAQHQVIGRKAAVKILQTQVSRDPDILARFYNEARVTAQIGHPGIVEMLEYGQHPSGSMYIIMEYLEGETLMSRLKRERKLAPALVSMIIRQMSSAVSAAHAAGITHRDLKPENVYLVPDKNAMAGIRVKVLDFGVAKLAPSGNPSVKTQVGAMLGTPQYFSPEQCQGAGTVDYRSDIYSMGCIMYELLTGKKVFYAQGLGELLAAHQRLAPPTLAQQDPTLPPELDALLQRMLAKRPTDRPQSLGEVERTLESISHAYGWDTIGSGPHPLAPNARSFQSSPGMASIAGSMHPSMAASMHPSMAASMAGMQPGMPSMYPSLMAAQMHQRPRKGRAVLMTLGALTLVGLGAVGTYLLTRPEAPETPKAVAVAEPPGDPPSAPVAVAPAPAKPAPAAAPAAAPAPAPAPEPKAEPAPAPAPAAPAEPVAAPAPPYAAAAAGAPTPATVKLRIVSEPPGAHVYRGEERLGVTPLEIEQPRAEGKLDLVLSLSGHPDAHVELATDRDGEAGFDFSAKPATAPAKATAPARPKPKKPVDL